MTTISHALAQYQLGARRRHSRSLWHDAGIGMALVLVVLAMVVIGGQAAPRSQFYHAWSDGQDATSLGGWENSMAPELFPLGAAGDELSQ